MTKTGDTQQDISLEQKRQENFPNLLQGNPGNNGGRPTKYDPKFAEDLLTYFITAKKNEQIIKREKIIKKSNGTEEIEREYATVACDLPTLDKFARKIGVNGDTLVKWDSRVYKKDYEIKELQGKRKHPEFHAAYNMAKVLQQEFLTDNALKGLYPPASFIFVAKNITSMRDKMAVDARLDADITSKGEKISQIVAFNYLPPITHDEPIDSNDQADI